MTGTPYEEYFKRVYKVANVQVNENPITATVTTSATKLLPANSQRLLAVIANLSANFGFVAPNSLVSATYGFKLNAGVGILESGIKDHGSLPTKEWWALNDTAQGTWYILEVLGW